MSLNGLISPVVSMVSGVPSVAHFDFMANLDSVDSFGHIGIVLTLASIAGPARLTGCRGRLR